MGIEEGLFRRRTEADKPIGVETQASPVVGAESIRAELERIATSHQTPFESDNPVILNQVIELVEKLAQKYGIGLNKYEETILERGQPEADAQNLIGEITLFINMFETEGSKKGKERYRAEEWQKAQQVMAELDQVGIGYAVRSEYFTSGHFMSVILTVLHDTRVMRYLDQKRQARMS